MKNKTTQSLNIMKKALVATIPVLSGYMVLGIGFGIILKSKGFGFLWALAMSSLIYAGSLEFVGINLMAGGAGLISVALTSLMVNARHLFYGISMIDRYQGAGARKPYMIFALTDETYSLVCDGKGPDGCVITEDTAPEKRREYHRYCFCVSLFDQIYWVTGSLLGSLLGDVIPFDTTGIDFALTALFITVFVQQWLTNRDHRPAIIGVVCSVVCLLLFGSSNFLIPAMILITAALCLLKKRAAEADVESAVSHLNPEESAEMAGLKSKVPGKEAADEH